MAVKRRTTIYDIAKAVNITPASVSRAFKDDPSIGKKTKELVRRTALKLNYKPNLKANSLRTGESRTLGIVVPKINDHFFANVVAGVEDIARQNNYHVLICQTDEQYEYEKSAIELLITQNVACIFISLSASTTKTTHLKEAQQYGIPVIQFDRTDDALQSPSIIIDDESAVLAAMAHLAAQGYKRIAHLAGPEHISVYAKRKRAFEKAVKQYKLSTRKEYIVPDCLTKESAKAAVTKLLQSKQPPDAIFAAADICALAALEVAKELNIPVPASLGICGFSNEPYTALTSPAITTIDQGSFEMGRQVATSFLQQKDARMKKVKPVIIPSKLIVRSSTSKRD